MGLSYPVPGRPWAGWDRSMTGLSTTNTTLGRSSEKLHRFKLANLPLPTPLLDGAFDDLPPRQILVDSQQPIELQGAFRAIAPIRNDLDARSHLGAVQQRTDLALQRVVARHGAVE